MESLGGCQFTCGATLDTWEGINNGIYFSELSVTNKLTKTPDKTERLGSLLEAPPMGDNNGRRMWGWLVPPVTGDYTFWIAADDYGEFWLSINDDPANKVRACFAPTLAAYDRDWYQYPQQQSTLIQLIAGQSYYFEVCVTRLHFVDLCLFHIICEYLPSKNANPHVCCILCFIFVQFRPS
jgi:hypothetical protein